MMRGSGGGGCYLAVAGERPGLVRGGGGGEWGGLAGLWTSWLQLADWWTEWEICLHHSGSPRAPHRQGCTPTYFRVFLGTSTSQSTVTSHLTPHTSHLTPTSRMQAYKLFNTPITLAANPLIIEPVFFFSIIPSIMSSSETWQRSGIFYYLPYPVQNDFD